MKLKSAKLANAIRVGHSDVSFHLDSAKLEIELVSYFVIRIENKRDGFKNNTSLYNCIEWVLDEEAIGGTSVSDIKPGKAASDAKKFKL